MTGDSFREFTLPHEARPERLDKALARLLDGEISREKVKTLLARGLVTVDGVTATLPRMAVSAGQRIRVELEVDFARPQARAGNLHILYRDQFLAVIDKPAGLTVHPCPSCTETTLVHNLLAEFPELNRMEGERPGIVHRLDKDTSGLMVVALDEKSRLRLATAFVGREMGKEYLALVMGVPAEPEGNIRLPIGRDPKVKVRMAVVPVEKGGREAYSHYRILHADPMGRFALTAVRIYTGRTHQIRVHMAALGHPLIGDATYGRPDAHANRQMLHAWKLRLRHPEDGRDMRFCAEPPPDFSQTFRSLACFFQPVVLTGMPGCGKSSVLRILADLGYPTWSADEAVSDLYRVGADGWLSLRGRYGERFVPEPDQAVDKAALFAAMRSDPALRREVESMIHPLVRSRLAVFWRQGASAHAQNQGPALAVAEVPLYLETGWRLDSAQKSAPPFPYPKPMLTGIWCPEYTRHARLAERGWDAQAMADMEAWQWSAVDKMRAADLLLDNSGTMADLRRRVHALARLFQEITDHRLEDTVGQVHSLWRCPG